MNSSACLPSKRLWICDINKFIYFSAYFRNRTIRFELSEVANFEGQAQSPQWSPVMPFSEVQDRQLPGKYEQSRLQNNLPLNSPRF